MHYAEAQALFEERNNILRWKLKADLNKFGTKGIEIKERNIPLIDNPYEGIDWVTVNHVKSGGSQISSMIFSNNDNSIKQKILLLSYEEMNTDLINNTDKPMYYLAKKISSATDKISLSSVLPPQIYSVDVNNYEGTITVVCGFTNKIEWLSSSNIIKTKYNIGGRFTTSFSVENLEDSSIKFRLTGSGGEIVSQEFKLQVS